MSDTRCDRCRKIARSKLAKAAYERYKPFCSYDCLKRAQLEAAMRYADSLPVNSDSGAA